MEPRIDVITLAANASSGRSSFTALSGWTHPGWSAPSSRGTTPPFTAAVQCERASALADALRLLSRPRRRPSQTFTLRLERADGIPADPPSIKSTVTNWRVGETTPLGRDQTLRVVGIVVSNEDQAASRATRGLGGSATAHDQSREDVSAEDDREYPTEQTEVGGEAKDE
jgi:hypothetical protein